MLLVPLSIRSPAAITLRFHSPTFSVDLTTVTAISLGVRRTDDSQDVWTMTIISATPDELIAQYIFSSSGSELTVTGLYYLSPTLTVPGGAVPADAVQMFVDNAAFASPRVEQSVWLAATVDVLTLGPVKQTWANISSGTYQALSTQPFIAADLRGGAATVTLWAALDGDSVVLADPYHQANSHALTVVAAAGQKLPLSNGTYTGSAAYSGSDLPLQLKFDASAASWFAW